MKVKLIFHHSEVLRNGTVQAIFKVVSGSRYKDYCGITIGKPHIKLTLHHLTEQNGIIMAHFNVPGYQNSLCVVAIGKRR